MASIKQIQLGNTTYTIDATTFTGLSPSDFVTIATNQTVTGIKTFNAPTNISGTEQATTIFNTANGGRIIFGKEAGNSGTMIGLDQVSGTRRLNFRASSTAGAIVWSQPESNSSLFYDVKQVYYRSSTVICFNNFTNASFLGTDSSGKLQKVTPKTLTFTSGDTTTTYNGTATVTVDLVTIVDLTGGL